jgi:hypothetical protein
LGKSLFRSKENVLMENAKEREIEKIETKFQRGKL